MNLFLLYFIIIFLKILYFLIKLFFKKFCLKTSSITTEFHGGTGPEQLVG